MTSSIPDGISFQDLQSFMDKAKDHSEHSLEHASKKEQMQIACELADSFEEQMGSYFAYKLLADYCLFMMYTQHNQGHESEVEKGNTESALCWARDAGQLQGMSNLLKCIYMGDQDFLCPTQD